MSSETTEKSVGLELLVAVGDFIDEAAKNIAELGGFTTLQRALVVAGVTTDVIDGVKAAFSENPKTAVAGVVFGVIAGAIVGPAALALLAEVGLAAEVAAVASAVAATAEEELGSELI
jgi:hypothetical protein